MINTKYSCHLRAKFIVINLLQLSTESQIESMKSDLLLSPNSLEEGDSFMVPNTRFVITSHQWTASDFYDAYLKKTDLSEIRRENSGKIRFPSKQYRNGRHNRPELGKQ